jgi:hypothetical protein
VRVTRCALSFLALLAVLVQKSTPPDAHATTDAGAGILWRSLPHALLALLVQKYAS